MKDGDVIQIAHVVRDIDSAMEHYYRDFGIGPWEVYTFSPETVRDSMYRGKPSDHRYKLAVCWVNGIQMELMQPEEGRSVYDEHLDAKGEGIHHIKLYFRDCQKALEDFRAKGYEVVQSGKIGEDEFYYLDSEENMSGLMIEIGNNGKIPPPERRFPA